MKYTHNPHLKFVDLPFEWKGNPLDNRGRFMNHEHPFNDSFREVLKWQFTKNPHKTEKKNDTWKLDVVRDSGFLESDKDCIVWLGHASFFIRLAGVSILIDPILFNVSLLKRKSELPVSPNSFMGLDYILISHDHRDHCDEKSLKLLSANNPETTYLTGLRLDNTISKLTGSNNIQAAGWYQQYKTQEEINVYYVPSRHWGRRYLRDTNKNLWGGYVIEGAGKTVYFSGDSGYGSHFSDIGKVFTDIDHCIIGVGAYKPEFFMGQSHISPNDAVKAFHEIGAKKLIPMHYGTFDLSDEPIGDPEKVLREINEKGAVNGQVLFLKPGEMEIFV